MIEMADEQAPTQQSGNVYSMVTLTPGLADKVFGDSSPDTVVGELWEFLNKELMTASLSEIDMLNILDYVDIRFANMLTGIPEDKWNDFKIVEQQWVAGPDGKPKLVDKRTYHIVELWDQIRTMVYIKCCNSKNGHLIKTVTESRSTISQLYEERGTARPPESVIPGQAQDQAQSGKPGWRFI